MSMLLMPVMHANLGGEMVYILQQRLTAQKIAPDRAQRVLHEVVSTMFSAKLLDELYRPQAAYTNASLRAVYDRLAHSSIMRLNQSSMDKLYDLMTMGVKYQIVAARCPAEAVVHVALNHLESLREAVAAAPAAVALMDAAIARFHSVYGALPAAGLAHVRRGMLGFFQNRRVRVTLLLEEKVQRRDGQFVVVAGALPQHIEVPGVIRAFAGAAYVYGGRGCYIHVFVCVCVWG
jgi:hypothetical protein